MSSDEPVRACICYPHTFAKILAVSRTRGWTSVEEITSALGCGSGCGLCRPYLAAMLKTGKTAFPVLKASDGDEVRVR